MRLVTYLADSGPRAAVETANGLVDLHQADESLPPDLRMLLAVEGGLEKAKAVSESSASQPLGKVRLLAPIQDPQKIICVGANYADHAAESGMDIPS